MSDVTDDRLPISAAAREVGEPERSLFRAVEQAKLPSTTREGVRVVSLADVRAWADRRAAARAASGATPLPVAAAAADQPATAGAVPSGHGSVAVAARPPSPGSPLGLDGEQAAPLFEAFARGESPADLVQRLRIAPAVAAAAWRDFQALQGPAGPRNATADRLAAAEAAIAELRAVCDALLTGGSVPMPVMELQSAVASIGHVLRDLPVPVRGAFTCQCGAHGYVATVLRCTCCGAETNWGFHPPKA